ncbi:hypothetical protein [Chryseobacterium sp. NKUCC03_KSP]|uniref:hypothetical protein n=1 Tax=Chryseobacterium sp. NKUCC03_KSP TaxID=2842125 RepID=UPI001C5A6800|nr:hypothetical protein [Chryseobacterium sp. NKUCC03_KSP]MBW3521428.1 hypothetical protein [Chryseobacterium sp. NKUCC03_KSP]
MRNIHLFIFVLIFVQSCSAQKNKITDNSCKQYKVLDSLKFIAFPNDNYSFSGNTVFKSIVKEKPTINNCLIEKIKDTTDSDIRIADSFNYKIGDVAFLLLPYVSTDKKINLREIMIEEFKDYVKEDRENIQFESLFYNVLHGNSSNKNLKNRLRLHKKIKEYFK